MKALLLSILMMLSMCSQVFAMGEINVLWDWRAPGEAKSALVDREKLPGINVLSPSWFVIDTASGHIKEHEASLEYVQKAHAKGYKVWALITNDFDPVMTSHLLKSPMGRAQVVREMRDLVKKYNLDGLNIDFENINPDDRDNLVFFVGEISRALHAEGVTVSMDVTVPSDSGYWSYCYDRKALAEHLDYLMIMAYDEHGARSDVSGSVASFPWVEAGIRATLAEGVPNDKILLGMPTYMRIWQEKDGNVKAKTLSMTRATELIKEKNLNPVWLSELGQYYFEYSEDDTRYRVWQENGRSLALKASLINRYDLAGGAYWRSTLESQDVWQILADTISAGK